VKTKWDKDGVPQLFSATPDPQEEPPRSTPPPTIALPQRQEVEVKLQTRAGRSVNKMGELMKLELWAGFVSWPLASGLKSELVADGYGTALST
jgi:hypothetical protein